MRKSYGTGAGKEILQPLAVVVLGGLFTSTALTLLVLPALYAKFGKFLIAQNREKVIEDIQVVQELVNYSNTNIEPHNY